MVIHFKTINQFVIDHDLRSASSLNFLEKPKQNMSKKKHQQNIMLRIATSRSKRKHTCANKEKLQQRNNSNVDFVIYPFPIRISELSASFFLFSFLWFVFSCSCALRLMLISIEIWITTANQPTIHTPRKIIHVDRGKNVEFVEQCKERRIDSTQHENEANT